MCTVYTQPQKYTSHSVYMCVKMEQTRNSEKNLHIIQQLASPTPPL